MRKKLLIALSPLLAVAAMASVPAAAYEVEHHFCNQELAPDGTCPPNGSSEYAHLYIIEGDADGASHETCIDYYGTNKGGYSEQTCMYYGGEEAKETPGGEYGYPRAWNGGTVTHEVAATEYGNK
jgi:hypothetical protein